MAARPLEHCSGVLQLRAALCKGGHALGSRSGSYAGTVKCCLREWLAEIFPDPCHRKTQPCKVTGGKPGFGKDPCAPCPLPLQRSSDSHQIPVPVSNLDVLRALPPSSTAREHIRGVKLQPQGLSSFRAGHVTPSTSCQTCPQSVKVSNQPALVPLVIPLELLILMEAVTAASRPQPHH